MWVNESSYTEVTSYTEADLANRFVIQLAGGGTGQDPCVSLVSITVWVIWTFNVYFVIHSCYFLWLLRMRNESGCFHRCICWMKGTGFNVSACLSVFLLSVCTTDVAAVINPHVVKPPWAEERRLRQWLNSGGSAAGGESFTVQCEDGLLSVTMDQRFLQVFIPQY